MMGMWNVRTWLVKVAGVLVHLAFAGLPACSATVERDGTTGEPKTPCVDPDAQPQEGAPCELAEHCTMAPPCFRAVCIDNVNGDDFCAYDRDPECPPCSPDAGTGEGK